MMIAVQMRGTVLSATLALALSLAPIATKAAHITNRDAKAHVLKVIEGSITKDHRLDAGGKLGNVCKNGCIVRIDASAEKDFILEGTERVSIENGLMYYDGEIITKVRKSTR